MLGLSVDAEMINAAILSDGGEIVSSDQIPTPQDSYRDCLLAINTLVDRMSGKLNASHDTATGIGLGVAGILQEDRLQNTPIGAFNDKPIKQDLQAALGCSIAVHGYGECFSLFEARHGAGIGVKSLFGMHVDANCTGGLILDGRPLAGANSIAGNWAHLPLPAPVPHELDGRDCWCGRVGCMETFVSGRALEQDYFQMTGTSTIAGTIAAAAKNSDIVAENTMQVLEDRLGRATAAIMNLLDPQMIVIGGIVAEMDRVFINVPRKWPGYVTARSPVTKVVPAQRGPFAAAAGAALLTQIGA